MAGLRSECESRTPLFSGAAELWTDLPAVMMPMIKISNKISVSKVFLLSVQSERVIDLIEAISGL